MPDPASTLMRRLLPRALAWRLALETKIRELFDGVSGAPEAARTFIDDVYDDMLPETTRSLEEWERQFGLFQRGTEDARRSLLRAAWAANGGQSAPYIQAVLRAAGFDVYVHECWAAPNLAYDPRNYTNDPTIGTVQCGEVLAQCGEPDALCNRFLANEVNYIVNQRLTYEAPPAIPTSPTKWPFFLYIGGPTFGDTAYVNPEDRAAFEDLLLRIRPLHLWIVTIVEYIDVLRVDGEPLLIDGLPVILV